MPYYDVVVRGFRATSALYKQLSNLVTSAVSHSDTRFVDILRLHACHEHDKDLMRLPYSVLNGFSLGPVQDGEEVELKWESEEGADAPGPVQPASQHRLSS